MKTEYAQLTINVKALTKKLNTTRKVTSSPIESSSNQSSPNLTTSDASRTRRSVNCVNMLRSFSIDITKIRPENKKVTTDPLNKEKSYDYIIIERYR